MRNSIRVSLILTLQLLASCSETTVPAAPPLASTHPNVHSEGPRQCTTPKKVCPYGIGPAGVPCSCWSNEGGAPHIGVTTK